jgi:hypothetical protein
MGTLSEACKTWRRVGMHVHCHLRALPCPGDFSVGSAIDNLEFSVHPSDSTAWASPAAAAPGHLPGDDTALPAPLRVLQRAFAAPTLPRQQGGRRWDMLSDRTATGPSSGEWVLHERYALPPSAAQQPPTTAQQGLRAQWQELAAKRVTWEAIMHVATQGRCCDALLHYKAMHVADPTFQSTAARSHTSGLPDVQLVPSPCLALLCDLPVACPALPCPAL